VAEPAATFAEICKFLEIGAEDSAIRRAVEATAISVLKDKEEKSGFKEKPPGAHRFFHSGRPTAWQTTLTQAQTATIESDHGQVMSKLGYLKSRELSAKF
jgi:aryl sulfotransferase